MDLNNPGLRWAMFINSGVYVFKHSREEIRKTLRQWVLA